MPSIADVERIIRQNQLNWLKVMEANNYNRIDLILLNPVRNVHTDVYGTESGEEGVVPVGKIEALVSGDTFSPTDSHSAGTLEAGWLFSSSELVKTGELVELVRDDGKTRRYKITEVEGIGTSIQVMRKFKLSSIGD